MILSPPGNPVGGYRRFEVSFVPSLFNFTTSLKLILNECKKFTPQYFEEITLVKSR